MPEKPPSIPPAEPEVIFVSPEEGEEEIREWDREAIIEANELFERLDALMMKGSGHSPNFEWPEIFQTVLPGRSEEFYKTFYGKMITAAVDIRAGRKPKDVAASDLLRILKAVIDAG